jgi:hypothetical protein
MQQFLGAGAYAHDSPVLGLEKFTVIQRGLAAIKKQADVFATAAEAAQATFASGFEVEV